MLRLLVALAAFLLLCACDESKPASDASSTGTEVGTSEDVSSQYPQVVERLRVRTHDASSVSASDIAKKFQLELAGGDLTLEACRVIGYDVEIIDYCCAAKCTRVCRKVIKTPVVDCVEPCKPGKPCSVEPQASTK